MDKITGNPKGTDSNEKDTGSFNEEEKKGFNEEQGDFDKEGGLSSKDMAKDRDLGRRGKNIDGIKRCSVNLIEETKNTKHTHQQSEAL